MSCLALARGLSAASGGNQRLRQLDEYLTTRLQFNRGVGKYKILVAVGGEDWLHSRKIMDRSELEKISKALADETRLRIFETIAATERIKCGDLVSMRGVTPATVSHHLKILSEARLINCCREGQFVYSEPIPKTIAAYTTTLAKIARGKQTKPHRRAPSERRPANNRST